jgi:hypothetical protein
MLTLTDRALLDSNASPTMLIAVMLRMFRRFIVLLLRLIVSHA